MEILRKDSMIFMDPIGVEIELEIKRFKEMIINKSRSQNLNNKSKSIKRVGP